MAKIETVATLKTGQFQNKIKGMKNGSNKFKGGFLKSMKASVGAVGIFVAAIAVAVAAVVKLTLKGAELGSKLSDLAFQSDLSVESFQEFKDAAIKAGSTGDKMSNALFRIQDAQGEVIKGDKLMTDAFKVFGLTAKDVAGMDTEGLMRRLGKELANTANKAEKINAIGDIIGKKNAKALKEALIIVGEGSKGAANVVSQETAELLDASEDLKQEIKTIWERGIQKVSAFTIKLFMSRKKIAELAAKSLERRIKRERDSEALKIAAVKKIEARELEAQKKILNKKKQGIEKIKKTTIGPAIVADALLKVGGMIGGGSINRPDAVRIATKQLLIQEKMAAYLETISKKENKSAGLA